MRASPPFPGAAIVSAEEHPRGWRFVAADGSAYEADSFVGALRLAGHEEVTALVAAQGIRYLPLGVDGAADEVREAESELLRLLPMHERTPLPLGVETWSAVGRTDGAVDLLRGSEILRYDARTLRVIRRHEAPGSACTLHRAWLGTRAVCTHAGWARAVFAEDRDWSVVRDELHAQPMGDVVFDDRTPLWAVGAACAETPAPQGNLACVYRADGAMFGVTLPFDGSPVAAHNGAVLFVEALRESPTSDAAIWRGGRLRRVTLPAPPAAARAASWTRDAITMIDGNTLLRVWLRDDRPRSALRLRAPEGARALVTSDATVFALARSRAWRLLGERWVPQPIAWEGRRESRDLSEGQGYCAGPWCRLSDALWWSAEGIRPTSALSMDHGP